jgi:protein-tyrosine phosphatase
MIDLHCHMLPGIDDGAGDDNVALEMARMASADGVFTVVCTPHVTPGVYDNGADAIYAAVARLDRMLADAGIPLNLAAGADVHIAPALHTQLRDKRVPTIARSRYFLFEPPHHVVPPRLPEAVTVLLRAGFVPIVTHPERLSWIETHYAMIGKLVAAGAPMQITAASLTGRFGRRPKYWAERMLDEGIVDFVASDGHDPVSRPPLLSEARDIIGAAHGEEMADRLFIGNPMKVLEDKPLHDRVATPAVVGAPARPVPAATRLAPQGGSARP